MDWDGWFFLIVIGMCWCCLLMFVWIWFIWIMKVWVMLWWLCWCWICFVWLLWCCMGWSVFINWGLSMWRFVLCWLSCRCKVLSREICLCLRWVSEIVWWLSLMLLMIDLDGICCVLVMWRGIKCGIWCRMLRFCFILLIGVICWWCVEVMFGNV